MKKYCLIVTLILCNYSFCQVTNSSFIQSPNAASLGVFGSIQVSPFTGLANVGINVFSLNEGDIPINGQLSYYSGGVRPAIHPGWVGQNWTLSVGGVVTRKQNGGVDEVAASNQTDDTKYAYYYHYNYLDDPIWSSSAFVQNYNSSGKKVVLAPDEFMFTLPNGISGSFFLNHLGTWVVKSKSAAGLKVSVNVNPQPYVLTNPNTGFSITIKRLIYVIKITDHQGFKYTFGNVPDAIEFGRGPRSTIWENNEDIVANAWYLTKIESPLSNVVNFQYIRKENQYVQNVGYPASSTVSVNVPALGFSCTSANNSPKSYSAQVITPCYLSQITASSFKVDFGISASNELKYSYAQGPQGPFYDLKFRYDDLEIVDIVNPTSAYINSISKWYKLDNINISDYNNQVKEKYTFEYNNVSSERLFLKKFIRKSIDGSKEQATNFSYNTVPLPSYNALKMDKWGFYNGILYPANPEQYSMQQLLTYFDMDNSYAQAGMLTSITYPTGGSTQFLYEPNDYAGVIQKNGNAINLANQTGIGGGLRINKVTDNDNNGNLYWKTYKYTKGATNISSGILAGDKKIKLDVQLASPTLAVGSMLDYTEASTFNFTDGKEVVYSEVKEELQDGSRTVYKFANSDNSIYMDETPANIYSDAWAARYTYPEQSLTYASSYSYPKLSHSSRELERGTLLAKEIYNAAGQLLYKTENVYNNDPARFNQYIRTYDNYSTKIDCSTTGSVNENYYQAVKLYTYFPYLQKQTEYSYNEAGSLLLKTETNYSYDPLTYQVIKKTATASNGDVVDSYIKYPKDFAGVPVYDAMTANNMLSSVVEASGYTNNILTAKNITNYQFWNNNTLIAPYSTQTQQKNNLPEPRVLFNAYNGKGKILEQQKLNDVKEVYLWGYNSTYPVARILNTTYDIAKTYITQSILDNPVDDATLRSHLNNLRNIPGALVTTYTYKPLVGATSETDVNGKTIYYEYDAYNRLSLLRDKDNNIIKRICYNYAGQPEDCPL